MKKLILLIFPIFFLIFLLSQTALNSLAQTDQCSTDPHSWPPPQIQYCLDQFNKALDLSVNATRPLESQLNSLQTQIKGIKGRVATIEIELVIKKQNIDKGYKELAKQKETLGKTIANYYIKSYLNSPFVLFLSSPSAINIIQNLAFQKALADQDREKIVNFAILLKSLEDQQKSLESEQVQLTSLKASLDSQSAKLDKIVSGARAYQASLSSQIAQLSSIQQQVLGQRLSELGIPLYASMAGGCASDIGKSPGFGGGYGFFTYGVPNRVGLNQFGAWGRAKAGQDSDTILRAYYNFDSIIDANQSIQITVQGYGTYSLEEYVKRIYEVPDSWTDNNSAALKAQAVAVRSYVLAYTNNGQNSICATDQCQVFKPDPKGGNWDQAVRDTAGKVMVQGGSPIKAWFSSTHGGYIHSSGDIGWSGTSWTKNAQDTNGSVASFADLNNNAYDKSSPWFYCDWGSRSSYNGTAWLTNDEVADIVNVLLLVQADSSTKEHLYQVDRSNPAGTDTWDAGRVKTELQNRGIIPFDTVSSISVSPDFGNGRVNSVSVSGNKSASFGGSDFKSYFNLRAPAKIQIVGPLYNIERN
ncbi:MAG TPA: SpoIID/LytB domain-containing protein [Patescibacteria group bacterium]|nr:SpoIID/LytB domain-containing protein [Patescibacteria group bacterium]